MNKFVLFLRKWNKVIPLKSTIYTPNKFYLRTLISYPYERNTFSKRYLKIILASAGVGILSGIGFSYFESNQSKTNNNIPITQENYPFLDKYPPNVKPTRKVIIPTDKTGLKISLFQYPTCPFCCKVRAFLDYYGISYDVIEVNPVLRKEISWSNYKKVPILLFEVENGFQQLFDSSMIISTLKSFFYGQNKDLKHLIEFYPNINFIDDNGNKKTEILNRYFLMIEEDLSKEQNEELNIERKWRIWADDVLVHVLSPNVYRTMDESLESFHWFSEKGEWDKTMSSWERYFVIYVGAIAMWYIGKRLQKRHNLKGDVRCSLYDECNRWTRELKNRGTKFLGGNKAPNLADLAVYGILSSIEGCQAFQDALDNTKIGTWYFEMKKLVSTHQGMR